MSLKTIVYGGRTIPRRPSSTNDCVLGDVFDAILPELAAECGWNEEEDTESINESRNEFIDAASLTDDGYEIMHNLEGSCGWDGSARLVEIFDRAPFRKCLSKHAQRWIDHFKIEPLFQVGDTVSFNHGHEQLTGVIESMDVRFEPGRYIVRVEGIDAKPVVCWENCEKA